MSLFGTKTAWHNMSRHCDWGLSSIVKMFDNRIDQDPDDHALHFGDAPSQSPRMPISASANIIDRPRWQQNERRVERGTGDHAARPRSHKTLIKYAMTNRRFLYPHTPIQTPNLKGMWRQTDQIHSPGPPHTRREKATQPTKEFAHKTWSKGNIYLGRCSVPNNGSNATYDWGATNEVADTTALPRFVDAFRPAQKHIAP